jgi:hypothetical protein
MALLRLADMMQSGRTVEAVCPRCHGKVTLPTQVKWFDPRGIYQPDGQCHRCGVTWSWHTERNPVTGNTSVRPGDKGKTNTWYCDRVLDAPWPEVLADD